MKRLKIRAIVDATAFGKTKNEAVTELKKAADVTMKATDKTYEKS